MADTIYLAYRGVPGALVAHLLMSKLRIQGYAVFLNVVDRLEGGPFPPQLLDRLEASSDVIVVLNEDALCSRGIGTWLTWEISNAIRLRKNVIPLFCEDYRLPDDLPPAIEELQFLNAVRLRHDYLDAAIDNLVKLLTAKSRKRRFVESLLSLGDLTVVISLWALAGWPLHAMWTGFS